MKKCLQQLLLLLGSLIATSAFAADLVQVYQQAFVSDPIFRQAIFQRCATKEGVPISFSALLPVAGITTNLSVSRAIASGSAVVTEAVTTRGYDMNLNISQTIFDFANIANLAQAIDISKQADAAVNAAVQDLIIRVARAYFAVLNDEDQLRYIIAAKEAYAKQLDQVEQQFKVGLKTITDVYTARAAYEGSRANYISTLNTLQNDRENLRVITGVYYKKLSKLSERFPLVPPNPTNIEKWVCIAQRQNWAIKEQQYATSAACQNVKQQFAGHLPTLQAQGSYDINFYHYATHDRNFEGFPAFVFNGSQQTHTRTGGLVLNVPLVQGGYVIASTRQAQFNYQVAVQQLEETIRETINNTRQSYLGVLSGISKIDADNEAVISSESSLEGLRAGYQVGTNTLIDVLLQQQKLYNAQSQYATDRYNYVFSLLSLKKAAGTLSFCDLQAINQWLIQTSHDIPSENIESTIQQSASSLPKQVVQVHHFKNKKSVKVLVKKSHLKSVSSGKTRMAHSKHSKLLKFAHHKKPLKLAKHPSKANGMLS